MKAINLDQPWAELIISGRKTIELRKTRIRHRGILGIRATKTVLEGLCRKYDIDPDEVTTNAIVGTVKLVDVIELNDRNWVELRDQHLVDMPSQGDWKWGWRLENPIRLASSLRYSGMPGMFDVPDEIADEILREIETRD